jgi:hypothetical protein
MRTLAVDQENEMILAFLRAEIDSPRYGALYAQRIVLNGWNPSVLIDKADLSKPAENDIRRALLGSVRGYGNNALLFIGFPRDVIWRSVLIDRGDYAKLKYMNDPSWVALSSGSRLVIDGAKNLEWTEDNRDPKPNVSGILRRLSEGESLAPLIGVESGDGFLILVEGHARATAYVLSDHAAFEMFVGSSAAIRKWRGF